ncbi:protein tyrosine phosphatase [Aquicoccus sp. G2-2]|uniref:fused DSP-PTPase phosphatase/NAD kinase-like protein n=1 Tax=Aquicoccus sp. G2-2 TaxID=3092120 RepID=UPI002ADF2CBA|nr:protein tyrosine phosphatase [Aquicoccus sp. G2-2]MEA1113767.1 protein tyrosine phosphatase [Aquicoccus sp. G2-2]
MTLTARFRAWRQTLKASFRTDLSTPENRRRARFYMLWYDHEFLRLPWTNFARVAEGVFRSNHPPRKRLEAYKRRGIHTIISLRNNTDTPSLLENEACTELGLTLIHMPLSARSAPPRDRLLGLIELFERIEKPFVMHCKSGADRASLASAIYLLTQENASVAEARKMLSPRFIHFKWTKTGILDHILDTYEARNAARPIAFGDWLEQEYDSTALQAEFNAGRGYR